MKEQGQQPLGGRTILITRARGQTAQITAQLESLGASVIHCPTIAVIPPSNWEALDASIDKLGEYDWILFTSANAVEFFFRRLREMRSDGEEVVKRRACFAIGPATARALEAEDTIPRVTASDSTAEGALKTIVDHLGGKDAVGGLKFLIPRARVARDVLLAGLRNLGAHVNDVETYQTVRPDIDPRDIIRRLEANSIDAITFTSPSTVSNFAALVGAKDLSNLLKNTLVACIGPVTAEAAASYGLVSVIQPEKYNANSLVESIVKSIGTDG